MVANTEKAQAMIDFLRAFADTIKQAKQIPSGHLYAAVMGSISLETYQRLIDKMVEMKIIRVRNHVIYWTGE